MSHCALIFSRNFRLWAGVLSLCAAQHGLALATQRADVLLGIVQNCVDTRAQNYCTQCKFPQTSAQCTTSPVCQSTTEVWSETHEFVAIRDIKMCGCPKEFVHGLVLPKTVVTGVEDVNKPNAIWQFAWDVGRTKILEKDLALVVNPQFRRSQNQLHVHLVRLKPGELTAMQSHVVGTVSSLNAVWQLAADKAKAKNFNDYGVMVTADPQAGYQVVITGESPEGLFTQAVCQP